MNIARLLVTVLCLSVVGATQVPNITKGEARETQSNPSLEPQTYLNTLAGVEYVGDEVCRACHASIYDSFKKTGMGRSTSTPSGDDLREAAKSINIANASLNRVYKVYARDGNLVHEESETDPDGHIVFSESHPVAFAVGAGDMGKSYLVFKGDALFLSPISYYNNIPGWDLSPGYKEGVFHGFNRRVVALCVDCHTGLPRFAPGETDRFGQPAFRFLTVGCERCHGPGATHVALRTMDPYVSGKIDPSIVNPRKLPSGARDDICVQCHQAGDARVPQPGKNYLDFRPGTSLGDVVAIYSVPPAIKGNHFVLLDQFEQLKLSKCWRASNGRLGCISCHDPHVQLQGRDAVDFYRGRCLTCHTNNSCTAQPAKRQATSPADNCIACHMPQQRGEKIEHATIADHRILKTQSEVPPALQQSSSIDLTSDTKPSGADVTLDLRNLALAYAQVSENFHEYDARALETLEVAAAAFPADAEIQAAYGTALIVTHARKPEVAAGALEKAIADGSKSAEVRARLARIRTQQGQVNAAIDLYKESTSLDPYYLVAYMDLARVYSKQNDSRDALGTLDQLLKIDPGNDAAREERRKIATAPSGGG